MNKCHECGRTTSLVKAAEGTNLVCYQCGNVVIRGYRCCLCPAKDGKTCSSDKCTFINQFTDSRGWIYFVRAGLGENQYKAFYRKPDKTPGFGEHAHRNLPWRETFDAAQEDLSKLALAKGWASL